MARLKTHAARRSPGVYCLGELGAAFQETIGKSMIDQDDELSIVTRGQVRDYLIDTYALLTSIIDTLLRRRGTIVEVGSDYTFICEVTRQEFETIRHRGVLFYRV